MKALLKFLLFLILGIVGLVIVAAIALPLLINPNDYKETIAEQVKKQTGRDLKITGDIDLSLSLPLSVAFELGETQISNAPGFGDKPFASIKQISVNASIFPLLQQKKLEIGQVIVDQVFVNLMRKKDGSSNWDDLAGGKTSPTKTEQTPSNPSDEPAAESQEIPPISIAGIKIINTHLIFDDQLNGQYIELKDLSVTSGEISEEKPINLSFNLGNSRISTSANKDQAIASVKQISIDAKIIPPFAQQHVEVGKVVMEQLQLQLSKAKNGVANWDSFASQSDKKAAKTPAKSTPAAKTKPAKNNTAATSQKKKVAPKISIAGVSINNTQITFDDHSSGQHIKLNDFNINISEVVEHKPIKIDISTAFNSSNLKLDGKFGLTSTATINLQQQRFQLDQTTFKVDVDGPAIPGGKNSTQLVGNILLDLTKQLFIISKMNLNSFDLAIQGELNVNKLLSAPEFKGSLTLASFSPKQLLKKLQIAVPAMKNDKVLTNAQVDMQFAGNSNKVQLTNLAANLDEISLKGKAAIINLSKPSYQVNLDINKLHLDDYALVAQESTTKPDKQKESNPGKPVAKNKPAPATTQNAPDAPLLPVEMLRQLNLDGQLKIGEILASGVKMTNVVLSLKGKNGLIKLAPVKSDFYKGKLIVSSTIDVRKKTPKIKFQQDFKQIDLGQLLQDATGTQEFTGTANISSNISTTGNYKKVLIKNSNGNAKLLISDGHIKKLDILHTLRKAQALYKGEAVPSKQQEANTAFTELKGSMKISKGVIKNNDLSSKSPLMALTGKGYVDLPKEYLDYTLKVKVLNTLSIDKKSDATDYRSYEIPYTIKGKFDQLSEQSDLKKVLAEKVKSEAKKKLKKKLQGKTGDKLKEKLGGDTAKKLESLFKF